MADSFGPHLLETTSSWNAPSPNLDRIKQRGRRLRRRRWFAVTAAGLVVVGMVGWGLNAVAPTSETRDERRVAAPEERSIAGSFQPAEVTGSPADAAATFAIRSVADAGLIDPVGRAWDYVGITGGDGVWTASFGIVECPVIGEGISVASDMCRGSDSTPVVEVTVESAETEFVVTDVSENAPPDERSRLLGARAEREREPARYEDLVVKTSRLEGESVAYGRSVWNGPIPSPDLHVRCAFEFFDNGGELIHRSRVVPHEGLSPSKEADRDGTTWRVDAPRNLDDASGAHLSCATYRWTDGPELGDLASNGYRVGDLRMSYTVPVDGADEPALVRIGHKTEWESDVFPGARSCVWTLSDDSGEVIAGERDEIYQLKPSFPGARGAYVDFEVSRLPASVSFECGERLDDPNMAHEARIDDYQAVDGAVLVDWSNRWPGENTTGASDCALRFEDADGNLHTEHDSLMGPGEVSDEDHRFEMPDEMDPFSVVDVSVACVPHVPQSEGG